MVRGDSKKQNGRWLANKYVTSGKKIFEIISLSINLLDIMSENIFFIRYYEGQIWHCC